MKYRRDHLIKRLWGDNFTDMGMVNRRNGQPDKQWALLYALAAGHGRMNWRSSEARRENAKRKQTLNERLAAFFGIDGEAITWDKNAKNYLCRFTLQPEGDEVSASVAARQQQANKAVPSQRRSTR